jgi:hypothetical protein
MPFRVTLDGRSWLSEDLTVDETCDIEAEVEDGWWFIVFEPVKTAKHARSILVRLSAREHGMEEARKRVGAMTVGQMFAAFEPVPEDDRPEQYEDGLPVVDPKSEPGEPATT